MKNQSCQKYIKSSFIISLVWTAKFYAALEIEYEVYSATAQKAANCALDTYDALSHAIEPNNFLEDSAPILFEWLCTN